MTRYSPQKIEPKWQKRWLKEKTFEPDFRRAKKPFYNLMMFPYPSAEGLHVGNMYAFTGSDIYGRFKRMQGYDVFEPIGLDGFGIHSENYALKIGKHPMELSRITEKNFYRQLGMIGNGFAWDGRLETYNPDYYKWTQWIFIRMFKEGLAYRKKQEVNWCPSCKTVLADEQVIAGKCERCGTAVIKKDLEQWFFKITDYADRLLKNLGKMDWSGRVKIAQRNWIGRSEGALIKFKIQNSKYKIIDKSLKFDSKLVPLVLSGEKYITYRLHAKYLEVGDQFALFNSAIGQQFAVGEITKIEHKKLRDISENAEGHERFKSRKEFYTTYSKYYGVTAGDSTEAWIYHFTLVSDTIEVFTTRPDTLFGATYLVIAPEHPLLRDQESGIRNQGEVEEYIKKAKTKSEEERIAEGREKTGVELKGIKAINPANNEEIPVWVADYVLGHVGTGAIMAVPAHDQRDFEFAKKFDLPIREVVEPLIIQKHGPDAAREGMSFTERDAVVCIVKHWKEDKYLCLKWKKIDWRGFVVGGVEDNEDIVSAAMREIREETGYTDVTFIQKLGGVIHAQFYHVLKDQNRWAHFTGLYLELKSGERIPIAQMERDIHDIKWLTPNEVEMFLNAEDMKILWRRFQNSDITYIGQGILINSGAFTGMDSEKAKWEITKSVKGKQTVNYRLRDWLISRQRYWGPPIPMIFCENCAKRSRTSIGSPTSDGSGWHPVPEKELPVRLPRIKNFRPTGTDKSPLASVESFYKVRCPKCRSWARRETDVSDTFLDSAWYFLRYPSVREEKKPWNPAITKKWLPVNMYIGGAEHSVLHLLYSRFLTMVFRDWKLVNFEEPFIKFRAHGLIIKDGAKMSKSKGNVVNPDEYIRAYGADALRMYLMFLGPFEQGGDFRDTGIKGITRFLERAWRFIEAKLDAKNARNNTRKKAKSAVERLIHKTIKKVTEDIENLQYNTAISALMILLNEFEEHTEEVSGEDINVFLKLLAPFAPHITEELWQKLRGTTQTSRGLTRKSQRQSASSPRKSAFSIHREPWPKYNPKLIQEDTFELVIQVNGKVRGRATLPIGAKEKEAKDAAMQIEQVRQYVTVEPRKVIFVPDKLINFVV